MVSRAVRTLLVVILAVACSGDLSLTFAAENVCLIPGRGAFHVYADPAGLFGTFAHEHDIQAGKIEGCASVDRDNLSRSSAKLTFAVAELHVLDPKASMEDRAKIQKTMETEVLRVAEYPSITFESMSVTEESPAKFLVRGNLTIRGKTQPAAIPVTVTHLDDGTYRVAGSYKFKQTDFGIQPIRLMGGTVRVKDEVRTEFELFLK